jgi:hypothetical protein
MREGRQCRCCPGARVLQGKELRRRPQGFHAFGCYNCRLCTSSMGYDLYARVLEFDSAEAREQWDWNSWDIDAQYPGVRDITNELVTSRFDHCHQIWRSWRDESGFPCPVRTNPDDEWEDVIISTLQNFYWQICDPDDAQRTAADLRRFYPNDSDLIEMAEWLKYWAPQRAHFHLSC